MVKSYLYISSKLAAMETKKKAVLFNVRHNFYDVCSPILFCVSEGPSLF